jgi:argininosuccinate lyase
LRAVEQAVLLSQVLVSGAKPAVARMSERAETGFTAATSMANRLVQRGVPFRTAHHMVGDAVRRAVQAGSTRLAEFGPPGWLDEIGLADEDLPALVRAQLYGGGPGSFAEPYRQATATWGAHKRWLGQCRQSAADAAAELAEAVRLLSLPGAPGGERSGVSRPGGDLA